MGTILCLIFIAVNGLGTFLALLGACHAIKWFHNKQHPENKIQ